MVRHHAVHLKYYINSKTTIKVDVYVDFDNKFIIILNSNIGLIHIYNMEIIQKEFDDINYNDYRIFQYGDFTKSFQEIEFDKDGNPEPDTIIDPKIIKQLFIIIK